MKSLNLHVAQPVGRWGRLGEFSWLLAVRNRSKCIHSTLIWRSLRIVRVRSSEIQFAQWVAHGRIFGTIMIFDCSRNSPSNDHVRSCSSIAEDANAPYCKLICLNHSLQTTEDNLRRVKPFKTMPRNLTKKKWNSRNLLLRESFEDVERSPLGVLSEFSPSSLRVLSESSTCLQILLYQVCNIKFVYGESLLPNHIERPSARTGEWGREVCEIALI